VRSPGCGSAGYVGSVVDTRRYLVVANQTLQGAELRDELRKRISAGPCSFFVIVPDTKAAQYDPVAAGGVLPEPGMWWWATYYARPATDEEATAQARERLRLMLDGLAAMGAAVEGDLGSSSPLEAMEKVCADHQFDEIIVATLPRHVSRWLRSDLPHQAGRRFRLPVTTIITSY
jgi:GABA permease